MHYKKWDIILVPFPFTDLSASKKRPALVVSPDEYNERLDVVIAFITSKIDLPKRAGDYHILDWKAANLPKPSMIRMKFATIDKTIIVRKLGAISDMDIIALKDELMQFFGG
ncbi:type II toxin-antitoxin system PemK/MazF family toxin [candidate division KSB1 bacterium]|nr:type II toxin-antitoxin system PemK/MazF family toxin [candidate division KSB1 bacterium]